MPYPFVEVIISEVQGLEDSTVYQAIIRKGEAKGRLAEAPEILLALDRDHYGSELLGLPRDGA